jgi:dTDP-4-dehydrorhamnose reductase
MSRLVVVGGTGLVGSHLVDEASLRGMEVLGTFHSRDPGDDRFTRTDVVDEAQVRDVLGGFRPDGVILTAAISDVDECERNPDTAWSVNVEGTLAVSMVCSEIGCPLLMVSSDYVFNGLKGAPYQEGDVMDPLSIYGRTKVEGERIVLDASPANKVARISVVYGWRGRSERDNIVLKVLRRLRGGREVDLYEDQWNCPTYAPMCASMMIDLLFTEIETMASFHGPEARIFHVCGKECVTRHELGQMVAEVFGLDIALLRPISMDDVDILAPRPRRICLDVERVETELNISIPSLRKTLEDMRSKEEDR